jgi:HupE / UreJ protein
MSDVRQTKRARFRPGPIVAVTIAWVVVTASTVRAHDPGLSTLDVSIGRETISLALSLARADVALVAPGQNVDPRSALTELARETIRVSLDGKVLSPVIDDVAIDQGGARVRATVALYGPSDRARRLAIASDVPKRLARGHRELLVITMGGSQKDQKLLDADSDSVAVDVGAPGGLPAVAWSFLKLGNRHILSGYDHLLFLAALFLAATTIRDLLVLLTAFTVAHSISLALVVFAGVHLPASIVEPLIAASIAWVGVENVIFHGRRSRWLLVFGFGLIHGFGFAGALADLGYGSTVLETALALFCFNVGIESGQLAVAAAILPLFWTARSGPVWRTRLQPLCSGLIAMAGGYWLFARLM